MKDPNIEMLKDSLKCAREDKRQCVEKYRKLQSSLESLIRLIEVNFEVVIERDPEYEWTIYTEQEHAELKGKR